MRAIVIDDELPSLHSMKRMLERCRVEVAALYQNPKEALAGAEALAADAAFVDIEMPGLNGLELASLLQSANPRLQIVFVTAYEQYAIEAFELAAVDYLLKPIQISRLEVTIKRLQTARPNAETRGSSRTALCLFYGLGILRDTGETSELPWRTTKAKEVFVYLLHAGDKATGKDELIDRIWPDAEPEKAVTYLHTNVYHIRQTIKNEHLPLSLEYKDGKYRIVCAPDVRIDAHTWEKELKEADEDADEAYRLLMDVYRGDYLETEAYLWAEAERERLRAIWLERALKFAERLEEEGAYSRAISIQQRIQGRFPEMESSYFGLMRLFDKLGNPAEVFHHYDKLARMLDEDFGIRPNGQIVSWYSEWSDRRAL